MTTSNSITITEAAASGPLSVSASGFSNTSGSGTCGKGGLGTPYRANVTVSASGGTPPYSVTITWKFSDGSVYGESGSPGTISFPYCSWNGTTYKTVTGGSASVTDSAGHTASASF